MDGFIQILGDFFVELGFSGGKNKWYKKANDGIIVCEFQRFRFDLNGSGFLNFGIVYPTLARTKLRVPGGEDTWNLRGRYKGLSNLHYSEEIFPLKISSDEEKRKVTGALRNIENLIIPYLVKYSLVENLFSDLEAGQFDHSRALTSITKVDVEKIIDAR